MIHLFAQQLGRINRYLSCRNNKYFPPLVYAGCLIAIYDFMLVPLGTSLGYSLVAATSLAGALFWPAWALFVSGGVAQRSLIKSDVYK